MHSNQKVLTTTKEAHHFQKYLTLFSTSEFRQELSVSVSLSFMLIFIAFFNNFRVTQEKTKMLLVSCVATACYYYF